jgi:hypothetical protein
MRGEHDLHPVGGLLDVLLNERQDAGMYRQLGLLDRDDRGSRHLEQGGDHPRHAQSAVGLLRRLEDLLAAAIGFPLVLELHGEVAGHLLHGHVDHVAGQPVQHRYEIRFPGVARLVVEDRDPVGAVAVHGLAGSYFWGPRSWSGKIE